MSLNLKSLFDFLKSNPSEQDCIGYFEKRRWKDKVISPFDPNSKVYKCANNRYKCKNTGKYFTVKTGSIFRNSNISLQKWFLALYLLSTDKKGISSCELAKKLNITQKSAWFVLHRLRYISNLPEFKVMLGNSVEIDETFIGGKNKNRHRDKKAPHCQGRNWKDKIPVLGIIERDGNLITQTIPNTKQETVNPIIRANVKEGSNVYTDEWYRHGDLYKNFNHQIVNHSIKQYVNGNASTNAIENAWSHLKRTIIGTYHQVSKKHLQRYLNEFTLRFNTRKHSEQERFDLVLLSSVGKSLSYKELCKISI
ncbi:Putative Transposase [endosymbiont DhMRE of Dentiscutata heterogama]|uniref:IS1595 family transposase n=1 Tax=endosymbiont DhMRE of Dentiscutata heterogama TaxID=1609546 RepID=UPI000629D334|nr:IS1595 family transposase [endosymbiont DhMRE of Dentiscutata heterogama]CFW92743.1 Putative transposase [endosymbiont DhMRE of Dentiscutata heterogama]CFW93113.1 Putative Transposase [endosymbiont DhMRE of Dentiscutata heterogama]